MEGEMKVAEGWITKRFDEIGTIFSGSTPSTSNRSLWDGNIVWVTPNDLSKLKTPYLRDSGKMITEKGLNSCSAQLLPAGSLIMSSRAPIGYVALPVVQFCTNQGCKTIKLKSGFHSEFTYYNVLFNIDKVKNLGEGTTFAEISKAALSTVELDFPTSLSEQAKIAEVLSTVDRAIEQTEALIAKQQRIKTGLMQDLLTRGIDEHGNLRSEKTHKFKDSLLGRIPVEWEIDTFGNRVDLIHGHQFRKYDFTEAGLSVVKIGQVTEKGLNISECSYVSPARQNEFSAYRIEEGDVLMALTGATLGKVCRVSSDFRSIFLLQNYRVGKFEPKLPKDLDKTYLYFLLQTNRLLNQVFQRVNAGAQGNVGKADFEKAIIFVPGFKEQQKAGMLLLLHDRKRAQLDANLIKLNAVKTALMQDLLTGKKRVTPMLEEVP